MNAEHAAVDSVDRTAVDPADRAGAAGAAGTFSPYVLCRRGTLSLSALAPLVPERTWGLLAEAEALEAEREAARERLEDALHAAIPELPTDARRRWLQVRRDVHNGRMPRALPSAAELPAQCREPLERWLRVQQRVRALRAEADAAYAAELDAARKALAEVAQAEDFQRGVQLSGEDVYREVQSYIADPFDTSRKASRRRRAERTIVSFAYRVVFKPSPFGSFTEIGAHPWDADPAPGERVARSSLSIGLLAWMAHQLHRIGGADELLRVRLNNSLAVSGDRATFVRRPIEGADDGFMPDRVITAKNSDLVRLLRDLLGAGELSQRELRARLTDAGLDAATAATTLDQLVKLGLCHRGLGLPDQTTDGAAVIAERLREVGTDAALRCAEIFDGLRSIETTYAAADARRRTGLLAELRRLVADFVEICGCPPPAKEAMRAAMYEDVGTRGRTAGWRPTLLERNRDAFALWQRIVPVLDDATIEKLGLYSFFTRRYGEDHPGVPFTELYRAFAELPPREASAVMCGVGDEHADGVRALRAELFAMLSARLRDRGGAGGAHGADLTDGAHLADGGGPVGNGAELPLDRDALRGFADALPATVAPWRSAAYRVQFAGDRIVVNGVTTGHGVFFSRYCDLLESRERGQWSLSERLRDHIARTWPRQTDITAALGLNFNLHPRLSPYELIYPGSVARPGADNVLTLPDLVVRADPATRRLQLVSTRDGRPIDLVPLNFLYPAAAPLLYRFLCAFAPTRTYRGGLWEQLDRHDPDAAGDRPRVLLDDLVLDRASWRVPVADVPAQAGLEHQELAAVTDFDRWRRARGVPRHVFFRVLTPPRPRGAERDLLEETRQWALEARSARLHKPHYLDTRNPLLLQVFAKQARSAPAGSVVLFHECLPAAEDYLAAASAAPTARGGAARPDPPPAPTNAEEFFVEFNLEGGGGGR